MHAQSIFTFSGQWSLVSPSVVTAQFGQAYSLCTFFWARFASVHVRPLYFRPTWQLNWEKSAMIHGACGRKSVDTWRHWCQIPHANLSYCHLISTWRSKLVQPFFQRSSTCLDTKIIIRVNPSLISGKEISSVFVCWSMLFSHDSLCYLNAPCGKMLEKQRSVKSVAKLEEKLTYTRQS